MHLDQLDVELQVSVRRNVRRGALPAVAHVSRDNQAALAAFPHASHANIPAGERVIFRGQNGGSIRRFSDCTWAGEKVLRSAYYAYPAMTSPTPSLKVKGLLPLESNVLPFFFRRPEHAGDNMMLKLVLAERAIALQRRVKAQAQKRGKGEKKRARANEKEKSMSWQTTHIPTYFIEQRLPLRATRPAPTLASIAVTPVGGEKLNDKAFNFRPPHRHACGCGCS